MERIEPPVSVKEMKFRFPDAPPSGRFMIEMEDISHGFGERMLYQKASLILERGKRIAIMGENGSGKTTLLKILAGELQPDKGLRRLGYGVKIAYFSQHLMEQLHPERTVLEEVMNSAAHPNQGEQRTLLGAFQFRGDDVFKKVKVLSGGEKSRLLLSKILLEGANLLLLDEPTNHLDISAREVLEDALIAFEGTVCLVTHDRKLMNTVADHLLVMRPGGWELHPGNFDDYARIWSNKPAPPEKAPLPEKDPEPAAVSSPAPKAPKKDKEQKRLEAEWRNRFSKERAPIETVIERIEKEIEKETKKMEQIEQELADQETYKDPERVKTVQVDYSYTKSRVDELTVEWEEHSLELEALKERMEKERPV